MSVDQLDVVVECRHPRDQRRMDVVRVGSGIHRHLVRHEICKVCGSCVAIW